MRCCGCGAAGGRIFARGHGQACVAEHRGTRVGALPAGARARVCAHGTTRQTYSCRPSLRRCANIQLRRNLQPKVEEIVPVIDVCVCAWRCIACSVPRPRPRFASCVTTHATAAAGDAASVCESVGCVLVSELMWHLLAWLAAAVEHIEAALQSTPLRQLVKAYLIRPAGIARSPAVTTQAKQVAPPPQACMCCVVASAGQRGAWRHTQQHARAASRPTPHPFGLSWRHAGICGRRGTPMPSHTQHAVSACARPCSRCR